MRREFEPTQVQVGNFNFMFNLVISSRPYLAQESSWCKVVFTAYLAVGGLLASYLPTWFPPPVKYSEDFTT